MKIFTNKYNINEGMRFDTESSGLQFPWGFEEGVHIDTVISELKQLLNLYERWTEGEDEFGAGIDDALSEMVMWKKRSNVTHVQNVGDEWIPLWN